MLEFAKIGIVATVLSILNTSFAADRVHQYTVKVLPGLLEMDIDVCFSTEPPNRLYSEYMDSADTITHLSASAKVSLPKPQGKTMDIQALQLGDCLNYRVNLTGMLKNLGRGAVIKLGGSLMTDSGAWLWRKRELDDDEDIQIKFQLPKNTQLSTPWANQFHEGKRVYTINHSPPSWTNLVVVGDIYLDELSIGEHQLNIAMIQQGTSFNKKDTKFWIQHAAESIVQAYGRFPVDLAQIVVVPLGKRSQPVPFGQVIRGGGSSIQFFVDQTRPSKEYIADWTSVHEFSHLLIPYIKRDGVWLSEGFASYYQNINRVRQGTLSEIEFWQQLIAGFERGRDNDQGQTLELTSKNMGRLNAFRRVYWGGALIAFEIDVRLRKMKQGQSLDSVLAAYHRCCSPYLQPIAAQEFLKKLDALSGTRLFSEVSNTHLKSRSIMDHSQLLSDIGVLQKRGKVQLDDNSVYASIRRNIVRAKL